MQTRSREDTLGKVGTQVAEKDVRVRIPEATPETVPIVGANGGWQPLSRLATLFIATSSSLASVQE